MVGCGARPLSQGLQQQPVTAVFVDKAHTQPFAQTASALALHMYSNGSDPEEACALRVEVLELWNSSQARQAERHPEHCKLNATL